MRYFVVLLLLLAVAMLIGGIERDVGLMPVALTGDSSLFLEKKRGP